MKRILLPGILPVLGLLLCCSSTQAETKFEDFDKVVKGAKEYTGLFRIYHKDDIVYAEIRTGQLNHPFLCPVSVARGMGLGGHTLNFEEQWVLMFKRVGDKVHLVRRNVRFRAKKGSPIAHAVETTYTDSVLLALPIKSIHSIRRSLLLNLNDIFMRDFADLGVGSFDRSRSKWHKIKVFPRNVELQIAATYSGSYRGGDSVIDRRGNTIIVHYGLCELPESGYQPRLADDRVGHFLSAVKDYSSDERDTSFLRYIKRWRLEPTRPIDSKNPKRLVPPKKKIVFWIEKSVPHQYRTYVRDGILEWNKAFAKIGFRDAIEVRQQHSEDFDPEDINYNTFRWITSDEGYAMGPSRANPLTGEIFDADIVFDASMVRYYRREAQVFGGESAIAEEVISPIRTARKGLDLTKLNLLPGSRYSWGAPGRRSPTRSTDPLRRAKLRAVRQGLCRCGPCLKRELNLLAVTLATRGLIGEAEKPGVLSEDLIGQAIKETVMHEVGHTLGLRHNFKASTMLKNEELHNTTITRKRGLVASVMDYNPVNLAPRGVKQGDYFSTTIGPYDYWAIEYAYKPLSGDTEGEYKELQKIASKCASGGLDYGTDEDLYTSADPYINTWDLGADPMQFGKNRMLLAEELLQRLADKGADKGEGYQRTRIAFNVLLQEYGNAAHLVSNYVGGVVMHRDHRGDPGGRDPLTPVPGAKQRQALKFLREHLLNDQTFRFSPTLLRRLAADRWSHWGNDRVWSQSVDFPVHERILGIQRVILQHLLNSRVLARIQNSALKADKDDKPLALAEVFRCLTDGIWKDRVEKGKKGKKEPAGSTIIRRNLQREYLKRLSGLVLGRGGSRFVPPDARSLARMHLREIAQGIEQKLKDKKAVPDDTTRAHLEESLERIQKVLGASIQISEP